LSQELYELLAGRPEGKRQSGAIGLDKRIVLRLI
jgi:hypothetical protein